MSKKEFWQRIDYVNCPEPNCKYRTKVRSSLIAHLAREHDYNFEEARNKADKAGVYCPLIYRRGNEPKQRRHKP